MFEKENYREISKRDIVKFVWDRHGTQHCHLIETGLDSVSLQISIIMPTIKSRNIVGETKEGKPILTR